MKHGRKQLYAQRKCRNDNVKEKEGIVSGADLFKVCEIMDSNIEK